MKNLLKIAVDNGIYNLDAGLKEVKIEGGYMVSIEQSNLKLYEQLAFIDNNPNYCLGLWIDDDYNLIVDISINILLLEDALSMAKDNHQEAIYDIENNKTIYLKNDKMTIVFYDKASGLEHKRTFKNIEDRDIYLSYLKSVKGVKGVHFEGGGEIDN